MFLILASSLVVILVVTMPTAYTSVFEHFQHPPSPCPSVVVQPEPAPENVGPHITELRMPVAVLPKNWVSRNEIATQALFRCLETSNCGQNQTKGVCSQAFALMLKLMVKLLCSGSPWIWRVPQRNRRIA